MSLSNSLRASLIVFGLVAGLVAASNFVIFTERKETTLSSGKTIINTPPKIVMTETPSTTPRKTLKIVYTLEDDAGAVASVDAHIVPVAREQGEQPQNARMPLLTASLENGPGRGYLDLGFAPWAGKEILISLIAKDRAGNEARTQARRLIAPARVLRNPLARALLEEREKIMKDSSASARMEAANVMAGIARRYDDVRHDLLSVLALRSGAVRLALNRDQRVVGQAADMLWRVALRVEEGDAGRAREVLAEKIAAFAKALEKGIDPQIGMNALGTLARASEAYFAACATGTECGLVRFLSETQGNGPKELFQGAFEDVVWALRDSDGIKARKALRALQAVVEEMPTTRPELSPSQNALAGKIFALSDFARAQKEAFEETRRLEATSNVKTKPVLSALAHRQRALFFALKEREEEVFSAVPGVEKSENAMEIAARLLEQGELAAARERQAEALGLLENALLALSEAMRRSSGERSNNF